MSLCPLDPDKMATHFKLLAVSQPCECSEMRQLVGLGIQYNNCEKLLQEQQSVGSQQRVQVYVTRVNRVKRKGARVRENFIWGSFLPHIFMEITVQSGVRVKQNHRSYISRKRSFWLHQGRLPPWRWERDSRCRQIHISSKNRNALLNRVLEVMAHVIRQKKVIIGIRI